MKKHDDKHVGRITSKSFLEKHTGEFRKQLEGQHYAPATLAEYDRCIAVFCSLMWRGRIDTASLNEKAVDRLIRKVQHHRGQDRSAAFMVKRFVQYLIESGVAPAMPAVTDDSARAQLRREYEHYLRNQRGLSEATVYSCWRLSDRKSVV